MNKTTIIAGTLVLAGLTTGAIVSLNEEKITLENPEVVVWEKPTTDEAWAEDVKKEGLNFKHDYQLQEMKVSHEAKLIEIQKQLEKTNYPDAIRWELKEQGIEEPELTKEVEQQISSLKYEYERLLQVIERINKEIELRKNKLVDRKMDILKTKPSTIEEAEALNELKQ